MWLAATVTFTGSHQFVRSAANNLKYMKNMALKSLLGTGSAISQSLSFYYMDEHSKKLFIFLVILYVILKQ